MSDHNELCKKCAEDAGGHKTWCMFYADRKGLGLQEAQQIIRILIEDKKETAAKHIYNGERMADWWKKWGKGELAFPVSKDYPQ